MAYQPPQATTRQAVRQSPRDQNVLLRVLNVDVQQKSLEAEVVPTSGCEIQAQVVKVQMDLQAMSTPEREQAARKARGSWFGGMIDQRTAGYCRREPMVVAQSARLNVQNGILYTRWLLAMGQANRILHGRASFIMGLEDSYGNGTHMATVRRVRLWSPSIITTDNAKVVEMVRQRIAKGARNSQLPRDTIDPSSGRPIIGAGMRRYAYSLIAYDSASSAILERTPVFSSYTPEGPYPDHVPPHLQTIERGGEVLQRAIPVDEMFFDQTLTGYRDYLADRGHGSETSMGIALACDLIPAQESGMKTMRPYTLNNRERFAEIYRANQIGFPLTPEADSATEIEVAVADTILGLSPQLNSINDYVNQACVSYPLEGSFIDHMTLQGSPLTVPAPLSSNTRTNSQ